MKRYLSLLRNAYRLPVIAHTSILTLVLIGIVSIIIAPIVYGIFGFIFALLFSGLVVAPLSGLLYKNMFTAEELKAWLYSDEYDSRRYQDTYEDRR